MNIHELQQEKFESKDQALDKYLREELKIEIPFFRPIVTKKNSLSPCEKGFVIMRFTLTETGKNQWQYILTNSEE